MLRYDVMFMEPFMLSLSTSIVADESRLPIRYAADMLHRDMRDRLTGRAKDNVIRVEIDAGLPEEHYEARACSRATTPG